MILHIGNEKTIKKKEIIGIFDMDTATTTETGREFLRRAQAEGNLIDAGGDEPRSFLLVGAKEYSFAAGIPIRDTASVVLSPSSTAALKARAAEAVMTEAIHFGSKKRSLGKL